MLELSEIVARINEGGIAHQLLCYVWIFLVLPLSLILAVIAIVRVNQQNSKSSQEKED